jgi:hypothetical protein
MTIAEQIVQKTNTRSVVERATSDQIESLRKLGLPDVALTFYREFLPTPMAEIAKVRLRVPREELSKLAKVVAPSFAAFFGSVHC